MALLRILDSSKPQEQQEIRELDRDEILIGREKDNTLCILDPGISRHHCKIVRKPDGWEVEDLGSANGTWVNDVQVTNQMLKDGDTLRLGKTFFQYMAPPEHEQTVLMSLDRQATSLFPQPAAPPSPRPEVGTPAPSRPEVGTFPPERPTPAPPPAPPSRPAAPPPKPPVIAAPPVRPPAPPPAPASRPAIPPPPRPVGTQPARPAPRPQVRPAPMGPMTYAGFWIRFAAYIIDGFILGLIGGIIMGPTLIVAGLMLRNRPPVMFAVVGLASLLVMAIALFYQLYFVGKRGATPGKKLLGLRIIREDGISPVGYGKAFLRLIGYVVSGMILYIGFIMIAFTDKKRGLHDMMAGTYVVKNG